MNVVSKISFSMFIFFSVGVLQAAPAPVAAVPVTKTLGGDPRRGLAYTDEFGPLNSNYSMGDFVRYTVTSGNVTPAQPLPGFSGNGLNIYYGMADIPYAHDIYMYDFNQNNLYNAVGYLFAGYAALNINPATFTTANWLTTLRQSGQGSSGSLGFDNNPTGKATIQLVDYSQTNSTAYSKPALGLVDNKVDIDHGRYFLNAKMDSRFCTKHDSVECFEHSPVLLKEASISVAWFVSEYHRSAVLAIPAHPKSKIGYAAPYGQFFGARLSHILGAVVNDVPTLANVVTNMQAGTPMPQMALLSGGPYTSSACSGATVASSSVPAGLTTASTAHFGTLNNFLTSLSANDAQGLANSIANAYLINHLLPTVARFATSNVSSSAASSSAAAPLCSYAISCSTTPAQNNLIVIDSEHVTAYDNGVIVSIQNNTGDALIINQWAGSGPVRIGQLALGSNNYFLHTASLMNSAAVAAMNSAANGSTTASVAPCMIELKDLAAGSSVYLQVLNGSQLATLETAMNTAFTGVTDNQGNPAGVSFEYNQGSSASPSCTDSNAQCLLISNFNPMVLPSSTASSSLTGNQSLTYRVQVINLTNFNQQPYFATLQVNKENIGYGVNQQQITQGTTGFVLYPSIVSIKKFFWQNPYLKVLGPKSYSSIPLLLIPDVVFKAGISGLKAHYGIWLMSYVAALTEFSFGCDFGDTFGALQNAFGVFDVIKQQPPARVVIDASGNLASGQYLLLNQPKVQANQASKPAASCQPPAECAIEQQPIKIQVNQATTPPLALMGSDVWDIGGNFHQDIPILNLYQGTQTDAYGNVIPVANQSGGPFVNLAVNFATPVASTTAPKTFAQGYGEPYSDMMLYSVPLADLKSGVFGQLSQPTPGNYVLVLMDQSQNVLAVQKVFLNAAASAISVNFLNSQDAGWNNLVNLPATVASVAVGQSTWFTLTYAVNGSQNVLTVSATKAPTPIPPQTQTPPANIPPSPHKKAKETKKHAKLAKGTKHASVVKKKKAKLQVSPSQTPASVTPNATPNATSNVTPGAVSN